VRTGPRAFAGGITPKDIKYASIYDGFTITVVFQLEDLSFCKRAATASFVAVELDFGRRQIAVEHRRRQSHPINRGGITKNYQAVHGSCAAKRIKGAGAEFAISRAHGTGGCSASATRHPPLILVRAYRGENAKYPAPVENPETARISGTRHARAFLIKRCIACKGTHYFPRSICPFDSTETVGGKGGGVIYSYSTVRNHADRAYAIEQYRWTKTPSLLTRIFVDTRLTAHENQPTRQDR
jgi:hypothetical protein